MQVNVIMSPAPCAVSADATAAQARRLLETQDLRELCVVDRGGVLIGLLRSEDVLASADSRNVRAIMRKAPPAIDDDDDLQEALTLMTANATTSLAVVGPRFELVGSLAYREVIARLRGTSRDTEPTLVGPAP